ncbi:MAG: YgiQ family radical SAM protein, partial [Endomicrobium sp.]|nr:YgiQ family radical SAM protein [Endomicrobium sp.]
MFLPTTKEEMQKLGWDKPDIILISGDTYIDSPFIGAAVIGSFLYSKGFKTAIIAQPDIKNDDIARLGEPNLFWGVTAGAMDSFVSNWTALNKFRNDDDLTPGGINNRRPDRASMVYTNLIRRYFKNTKPIVLGGVEASLRRIAHYDFKDNALRRSILFDAKADILIYGMGEKTTWELAQALQKCGEREQNETWKNIKGLCYISKEPKEDALEIAPFEKCLENKDNFFEAFNVFYKNCISEDEKVLMQKHNDRYLIHNPKQPILKQEELDEIYDLPYTREVHPFYAKFGKVKAQDTIKFSITSHRGCFGECNFCSIAVHQGKVVVSRSEKSIIKEAQSITQLKDFKGYISDVGGPTANMLYAYCKVNGNAGCDKRRCLFPQECSNLIYGHDKQMEILKKIAAIDNVKKVFISSGIRYDMICSDKENGQTYLETISQNHISGQMKIAPEHFNDRVLEL